ncbi:hypothetical protein Bca4012_069367 [Brassica carinata]
MFCVLSEFTLSSDAIPTRKAMLLQIYVAMKAMPWYTLLPTVSEYMIESGWTRCYSRVGEVSWILYFVSIATYLVLVEFGIYWMHRELHDIKPLYKYLHATHHIYNKQNTLSPFAGLAFHPLDGILQAVPHVIALFIVPIHFTTHLGLLFMEAIWTANIHDCIHDSIPTRKAMVVQIYVAMKAMPWSTLVPTVSEYMIERGWTKCYSRFDQFNLFLCLVCIALYLVLVEFMIYWVHKMTHDVRFLYNHIHASHHIYNKQNTLSPFAGLAFHPLDGILQAVPHVIALFIVPIHLITHLSLLIMEGVWTASNHDCINGNIWPIMGAGYHTIHHTTYKHNYGHYTICMDWLFGSLKVPNLAEDDSFNEKAK